MRPIGFAIAGLCALVCSAAPAFADDPDTGSNAEVLTRARPEYDARGARMGSFFLYPSLTGGFGYTDNVFNDASNTTDYFYTLAPQVRLQSSWSRHELTLSAGSKSYWFSNQASENRTDLNFEATTRLDIARGSELKANAHYLDLHEPRGTDVTGGLQPGDPSEPTPYTRTGFGAEFDQTLNRVRLSLGASIDDYDFSDVLSVDGTTTINNDDRDRTVTEAFVKAATEISEDTAVFLRGRVEDHDFAAQTDDQGLNRDSTGVGIDGGFEFRMTHVLVGEVFAGYTTRSYDDAAFAETGNLAFGAALKWFPSMLTTISVDGARTIEDTSIANASGYISTRGEVGLDHELLRNVILSGRLGYENAEYQEVTRNDDTLHGSIAGRFLINNNLHFDAGWEFTNRDSSDQQFEYSSGQFQLSLTGKM